MRMEDFITRAGELSRCIRVEPGTYTIGSMSKLVVGTAIVSSVGGLVLMEDKYDEMNDLAKQCGGLISMYERVSDIVAKNAGLEAGEKSYIHRRIKENRQQRGELISEREGIIPRISFFQEKEAEYARDLTNLQKEEQEIRERINSPMIFIPFYGLQYAVETKKMADEYEQKKKRNKVMANWLDENRGEYNNNRKRRDNLEIQLKNLEKELKELQEKFGDIIEVLDVLNCMIVSLGDFITNIGKAQNALKSAFYDEVNEAQTAIEQTVGMIAGYYDVFRQKLKMISGKLEQDEYNQIINLIEGRERRPEE